MTSASDIYRFRKQRGVNLGSWFVLEKWITETPFASARAPAVSDLDVARGSDAKPTLERHWDSWIQNDDWKWLSDHKINTVRLPIGYYHLCGCDPQVLEGTDFESHYDIFKGAWKRILDAISTAASFGIGVLVDLHAAPGSQNKDSHSGTSGGQVKFWSPSNLASTLVALRLLASQISKIPNVVGLELFNEPANNNALQGWYERVIPELRNITGSEFPIYISDAWDLQWYAQLVGKRDDFTVVDHHLYRCFTPADHAMSGDAHAQAIRTSTFSHLQDMSQKAHGNIVIGEYSSALNPASVGHNSPAGEQDRQRRVFSQAQLETYEKCCAGAFFWTYKKENGWDAGWSLKDTMRAEIMPLALGKPRMERRESTIEAKRRSEETAFDTHKKYWSSRPGHYEHWRFDRGFSRGWDDAYAFFDFEAGSSVSELGFKGEWTRRRVREHAKESGVGANMWEFEHGFEQGYSAAHSAYFD